MLRFPFLIIVFTTIGFAAVACRNHKYLDPEWIDPHDWNHNRDSLDKLCPQNDACKPCERTVRPEYFRLVNAIFDPNEFRFDESTNYLYRTVHIHVTKDQLDELKKSKDPVFIDGLVSKILAQTEFGTVQLVKEYTVDLAQTIWSHMPSLSSDGDFIFNSLPRSRPILINFAVVILSYLVCRRFHINYLVVAFFGLTYFLYEYLDAECHNRIEINETVDLIYGNEKNPCMGPSKMNWYDWIIGRDSKSACRDFLAKQRAYQNQCGVIDLFHEFFTTIVMKQLKTFFTSLAEMVHSISTTNGILITAVTLYFMKDLLVTLIQSVFKYVLNPTVWSRVAADIHTQPEQSTPSRSSQNSELQSDPDIRDRNVSKALDLAHQQMQLLLDHKKAELSQLQPSGIEMLAVKESPENTSRSDQSPGSSSVASRTEFSDENSSKSEILPASSSIETASHMSDSLGASTNSLEAFHIGDIATADQAKESFISVPSTVHSLPSTVTIGDSQSSGNLSEHSATFSSTTNSTKSADADEFNSNEGAVSDSDSVEILSISSGNSSS